MLNLNYLLVSFFNCVQIKRLTSIKALEVEGTTCACLLAVLDEDLAINCSWTGDMDTHAIKDCFFIKIILGKIIK